MLVGYEITIIVLMLFVNAVFATYEMALASLSQARIVTLCREKRKGAEQALYMKKRMEASLAFIQIGITLAAAVAAATGGAGVHEYFTPYLIETVGLPPVVAESIALICFVIPLSAVTIVFGELVPKVFALSNKEKVCLGLSPLMKLLAGMTHPVVALFENLVKLIMGSRGSGAKQGGPDRQQSLHEVRAAVALARTSRLISATDEKIMLSAAQLFSRSVGDILLPASEIAMISLSDKLSDAMIKAHMDMHTRFPVCGREDDPDSIVGYVNFKDIVHALKVNPHNPTIEGIVRPIKRLPQNISLSQALSEMIQEKSHISLVDGEGGKAIGMITLEDILEELVGEIEDEYDRLPAHLYHYGSSWIAGGGLSVRQLADATQVNISQPADENPHMHLAEFAGARLGRAPRPGEVFELDELEVTVRKLRRNKLCEAVIQLKKKKETGSPGERK